VPRGTANFDLATNSLSPAWVVSVRSLLGRGSLKQFNCWFGSGPSDPLRSGHSIGNASTQRLAKSARMGDFGNSALPPNRTDNLRLHRTSAWCNFGDCSQGASERSARQP